MNYLQRDEVRRLEVREVRRAKRDVFKRRRDGRVNGEGDERDYGMDVDVRRGRGVRIAGGVEREPARQCGGQRAKEDGDGSGLFL